MSKRIVNRDIKITSKLLWLTQEREIEWKAVKGFRHPNRYSEYIFAVVIDGHMFHLTKIEQKVRLCIVDDDGLCPWTSIESSALGDLYNTVSSITANLDQFFEELLNAD